MADIYSVIRLYSSVILLVISLGPVVGKGSSRDSRGLGNMSFFDVRPVRKRCLTPSVRTGDDEM